jgi:DNA mismatch endonuclease (patch repair protein)
MDTLTREERSILMSKVRSTGNRSTERRLRLALVRRGISGWQMHPRLVTGQPDFWFPKRRVAVFVDGCFWHGCPRCLRLPKANRKYWRSKIDGNKKRARGVARLLKASGIRTLRVWEHRLRTEMGRKEVVDEIFRRIILHASRAADPTSVE